MALLTRALSSILTDHSGSAQGQSGHSCSGCHPSRDSVILGVSVSTVAGGISGSSWDFWGTLHHRSGEMKEIHAHYPNVHNPDAVSLTVPPVP